MAKWLILLMLSAISACGADLLPAVGTALQTTKDVYRQVDGVRVKVDDAYARMCLPTPIVPEVAPVCAEVDPLLDDAVKFQSVARKKIDEAINVYSAVNEAAK